MADYARLIDIFEKLVSFKTISGDREASAACLNYAEKILDTQGLHIDRYSSNGFESIVATTKVSKAPTLLLQAHLDVVPAADDMFQLRGEGPNLVGRGAYDMKYAAACYLYLVEELGPACAGMDFGIMFTTDEEVDGRNGVQYLLDQGYSCDVCVLPDGGDNWRVESAAKGQWLVDAEATGVSAHGSRPWEGDNAALKLLQFVQEATALAPVKRHTDTTVVVTKLQAGVAINQVPDSGTACFDIRFLTMPAYEAIHATLTRLAKKHHVELTDRNKIIPLELDVNLPQVQTWVQTVETIRGDDAPDGYSLSFGATDARFFAEHGIPTIVTRPKGGGIHAEGEWIVEAEVYQFYDCLKKYTETIASPAATP